MRLTSALRSAVAASLLLATPVLAASESAPAPAPGAEQGTHRHGGRGHKDFKHERKFERMQHRLDRAVSEGRLTQAQADELKAEGQKLREEFKAQREAAGGQQLTDAQREQMREKLRTYRDKVKATLKPKDAQPTKQL